MGNRERARAALARLTSPPEGRPAPMTAAALEPARLQGVTMRPGARVRDESSGLEGEVIHASYVRGPAPAP